MKITTPGFRSRRVSTSRPRFLNRISMGVFQSTSFVPITTSAMSGLYPFSHEESLPPSPTPSTIPPMVYPPCPSFPRSNEYPEKLGEVVEPTKSTS